MWQLNWHVLRKKHSFAACLWWPRVLSKQQLLAALSGLLTSVTFCPHMSLCCLSGTLYAYFWEQLLQLHAVYCCLLFPCVQKHHHTEFAPEIRLHCRMTCWLLTSAFPITLSLQVSLKDCMSVLQCMAISDLYSNFKLKISDVVLLLLNYR